MKGITLADCGGRLQGRNTMIGGRMKLKRILCGVDFLPASIRAFEIASELAQTFQAALHIMHVTEAYPGVPVWSSSNPQESTISIEEKAEAAMETLIRRLADAVGEVDLTTEITMGRAYAELVNRAREFQADLIVLGAKGLT